MNDQIDQTDAPGPYDGAPCGYHTSLEDGTIVRINDTELSWLGYSREEVVGKLKLQDLLSGPAREGEVELRRKDGSILTLLLRSASAWDPGRRAVVSRAAAVDLTELKRIRQETAEQEDGLRQFRKMEALGRFACGIAHDFNNILSVIWGCSQVLSEAVATGDPGHEEADLARKAAGRGIVLTRQLLAFSRKEPLQPKVLDLNFEVVEILGMVRSLIPKNIAVLTAFETSPGRVLADSGEIGQVVMNLVLNARDAMPSGGVLRVGISFVERAAGDPAARPGRHVLLTVGDTSPGLRPEVRARLFEPFFTTKARGKGTGLGLSVVRDIVDRCGGSIRVGGEPGRGTTFEIYFPRVDAPERAPAENGSATGSAGPSTPASSGSPA